MSFEIIDLDPSWHLQEEEEEALSFCHDLCLLTIYWIKVFSEASFYFVYFSDDVSFKIYIHIFLYIYV